MSPGELTDTVTQFNVSPKLTNSGMPQHTRTRLPVLHELAQTPASVFKFVVLDEVDLEEVSDLVTELDLDPDRVFIMAEGTTTEDVLERSRALADPVLRRGWNLTPRWHTLLWNDEPGR